MDLHDYVRVLRKHWRLIAACALVAAGLSAARVMQATPLYRTGVTFFVSIPADTENASNAYTGGLFSQQRVKSYADIVGSRSVAESVASALGAPVSTVAGRISGRAVPETVLLKVSVTAASPDHAVAIASAVATEFPRVVARIEAPPGGGASPINVSLTDKPQRPTQPFSPRPARSLVVAVALGLVVGTGVAGTRDALDNTVKVPADIADAAGTATLGAIKFDPGAAKRPLVVRDEPNAPRAEAFRQLRTNLQFVEIDRPLRSFVVTSSVPGEGKSTLSCNLAITLAQAGIEVCLVEGDLRRPRVSEYLGLDGAVGLTSVVLGRVELDDALQRWGAGTLTVLASGPIPPNPSEVLSSHAVQSIVTELERRFTVVIIDAPPLLPVTDAAVLAAVSDGAVLVVRAGSTKRDQLRLAADALRAVDATILGGVLNMVPRRGPDSYYGHGYAYQYTSTDARPRLSADDSLAILSGSTSSRVPGATAPSRQRDPQSGPHI